MTLGKSEASRVRRIMKARNRTARGERRAIARVVAYLERVSARKLNFRRDNPFSYQNDLGIRGQMDCIDESLNTIAALKMLQNAGLLRHHTVHHRYAERGVLLDGRYPHKSARIIDKGGKSWAVDSWYRSNGKRPKILPLKKWYKERSSDTA